MLISGCFGDSQCTAWKPNCDAYLKTCFKCENNSHCMNKRTDNKQQCQVESGKCIMPSWPSM